MIEHRPTRRARIRDHPFIRLALDVRFATFWVGQTISLFGDRLHQVALGVLVYNLSGSALLTGLVFLAATLPNVILSPIAGTFVDRWDQKRVMVFSDLIRAGLVALIPWIISVELALVYPLVFAITAVTLFFRPAKTAVIPRIVSRRDLLAANSATWTSENLADIIGYPLAGVFVALLGNAISLAFFVDALSYLISALFISAVIIPPVIRNSVAASSDALRTFIAEMRDGWHMLRQEAVLFQNTLVSAIAQASIGATLALLVVFAGEALDGTIIPYPQNYATIEAVVGVGNFIGGIVVGMVGARARKGPLIIGGFIAMGLGTVLLGLSSNVLLALVAAFIIGVSNLVFVIPTVTLFAEVTPPDYMGRVIAFRSSFVYGSLTGAMAVSGLLAETFPVGLVIAAFGLLTALAGIIAMFLPAVRNS